MVTTTSMARFYHGVRLPKLLRQVQDGKRFTITHRGKPIAELGPPPAA